MTAEFIRSVLGWCTVLNSGFLMFWAGMFLAGPTWIYRIHSRMFSISEERFHSIHYAGIAYYKLSILLFNLVPYLALRIVG